MSVHLIVFGAGVIFVAVAADFLGLGGHPKMGTRQILLAIAGFAVLLIGKYKLDWRRMVADSSPPVSWRQLLIMAAWFGLLTGFLEFLVRELFVKIIFNLNPHLFWMITLANLILFTIIGLILLPVRRWPKVVSLRITTFIFILLGCLAPLLNFPQIDIWARVLLAVGLAVQLSRLVAAHSNGFHTFVRRTLPWMLILAVGGSSVGIYESSTLSENRTLAKLPPAMPSAPNVLLLVLDTVRAQNLSLYGYHRPTTPRLEQFAKTGILFERALSTSPWTLPAHATMFTGRFTHELFPEGQTPLDATVPLRDEYPTLAEILSEHGYATAGFVANLGYCAAAYGLSRGFARYEDYMPSLELLLGSSALAVKLVRQYRELTEKQNVIDHRKRAEDVNNSFLHWLSRREGRPFFAFLNYYDAHDPYLPPYPFELKFGSKKPEDAQIAHGRKYKSHEIQELQDVYDSCIAYIDHEIGSLLDKLQEQGVLECTVVIITSDHGEQFGEHGLMYHGNSLYSQLLHVPLLISFSKNLPAGKRIRQPVSLRDLPNTVVDLVGIDDITRFPGSSLARHWVDARASANGEVETHFAEVFVGGETPNWFQESWPVYKGSMQSLVREGYHYIRYGDGNEELFDFENDPKEEHDRADSEGDRAMLKLMRAALETALALSQEN
ncbi:sulfatase-like hydrolase/transferase [candidate division KSB1 bacterium]|nr:sulfatase-like hydrolase/transferase [candidate division KSB1 bacterium]